MRERKAVFASEILKALVPELLHRRQLEHGDRIPHGHGAIEQHHVRGGRATLPAREPPQHHAGARRRSLHARVLFAEPNPVHAGERVRRHDPPADGHSAGIAYYLGNPGAAAQEMELAPIF